ncbi:hypothetical protein [Amycolatopsis mediterranei]|uniref:hypothetical protein n=1 Tax=Amycolatopsis mediterranei TaxID=33910 RepID=UPI0012BC6F9B|nr:hypothetical protein [Amycolatopsis mediterranei]UZF70118.1 hypothetical protein ISP_003307 [Amycolatopsis mediterranei]
MNSTNARITKPRRAAGSAGASGGSRPASSWISGYAASRSARWFGKYRDVPGDRTGTPTR